jgi:hypothetical protein
MTAHSPLYVAHHAQKLHHKINDGRLFNWDSEHGKIHILDNPIAFIILHFVNH